VNNCTKKYTEYKSLYFLYLKTNCLSAIRFRGGVILQVSCYTLLVRIPTSMATVLLSAPHGTPFRFIGRLEQIGLSPAYLESVRLNPSSPVLLTRNGPLRIFDTRRSLQTGGGHSPTLSKLDRVFSTIEWENLFPNCLLQSAASQDSDHCPLILGLNDMLPGKGRFQFASFWPRLAGFRR